MISKGSISFVKKERQFRNFKVWSEEDDRLLIDLAHKHNFKWKTVAQQFKDRNQNQCLHRYRRLSLPINRRQWAQDEDLKIKHLVEKIGKKWVEISKHFQNKTGKQIRERYLNVLDPLINRGPWREEQDLLIIRLYNQIGSKWNVISKELVGRPQNIVKNRFYSHILRFYQKENPIKEEFSDPDSTRKDEPIFEEPKSVSQIQNQVFEKCQQESVNVVFGSNVMEGCSYLQLMPRDQPGLNNKTSFFYSSQTK